MRGEAQAHLIEMVDGSSYVVKFTNNSQHPPTNRQASFRHLKSLRSPLRHDHHVPSRPKGANEAASQGTTAPRSIESEKPDIVVLDLNLWYCNYPYVRFVIRQEVSRQFGHKKKAYYDPGRGR